MKIFIDGKYYDEEQAKISVFDHGLLYGDGVFEGIRAYNGRVFRLKEHIDRLFYSAKAILLTIPLSREKIAAAVIESCRKNKIRAKIEANNAGVEEAVLLNAEGFVSECTADNIFIVKANKLFTPPLSAG